MQTAPRSGGWLIILSFIIAVMLEMVPLPDELRPFVPGWLVMTLVFWCLTLPQRVGVGVGWLVGLLFDVVYGSTLGLHAAGFAVTAYVVLRLHQRVRTFPVWQQAVMIALLVLANQLFEMWVKGMTGQAVMDWRYLAAMPASALVWPLYSFLWDEARIRYGVK